MVKWLSKHSILEQIVLELTVFIFIVVGSFSEKILFNSVRFDLKTGVKIFGQYKNNGIKKCPLLRISPLFQKKVEVMDTIKSMEIYLVKLLIRRSLVQVQQGKPKIPFTQVGGILLITSYLFTLTSAKIPNGIFGK